MNEKNKMDNKLHRTTSHYHAQADGVTVTERRLVQKYNRLTFGVGLFLAIVVPPLIYRWKRKSMEVNQFN